MRDPTLHSTLEAFTREAASQLTAETASGAEIPFELVQAGSGQRGRPALYCYRPLTADFISEHLGAISGLPTYLPALRSLADRDGLPAYLTVRGEMRVPRQPRERADVALSLFLSRVFAERTDFGLDQARFDAAYEELEGALYEGRCVATVIAPLLGLALESEAEIALDGELSLAPAEAIPDAPADAAWADGEHPSVLAVLRVTRERSARPPLAEARTRFRKVLSALRLFEGGGFALGPIAWSRTDDGPWRPAAIGGSGPPGEPALITLEQEDELRAFCNLTSRRIPGSGELAWALARYEMGCERSESLEALTDHVLALRALLEPEGPESGRLSGRLAAICAAPEQRAAMAERIARALSFERAVMSGLTEDEGAPASELSEHLRAILRDVLCGHLDPDLCSLADHLLAEASHTHA